MIIDMIATEPHYIDHLAPVWVHLPEENRGSFVCPDGEAAHAQEVGITPRYFPPNGQRGDVVVTASWSDMGGIFGYSKRVLMEHGVGQTYQGLEWNPHYAGGGPQRDKVDLFLSPNDRCRKINERAHPGAEHHTIGSPFLDMLRACVHYVGTTPTDIAVSFHYDAADMIPEAGNAWRWIGSEIPKLTDLADVIGHAHPRLFNEIKPWYLDRGIAAAWWFPAVADLSWVYVCDNSSSMYQFAALDRPVVVLNPPHYRRDVEHGLRFWDMADVGVQVNDPSQLLDATALAWEDPPAVRDRRLEIVAGLFPYADEGAHRAVDALLSL